MKNGCGLSFSAPASCTGHFALDPVRPSARASASFPSDAAYRASATALLLALSLTACQTPALKDRIVEVDKPIAVQPIKPADVPKVPAPLPKRPSSLSAAADVLLSKICELEAYVLRADPLLRVSAGMPQQALAKYPECE